MSESEEKYFHCSGVLSLSLDVGNSGSKVLLSDEIAKFMRPALCLLVEGMDTNVTNKSTLHFCKPFSTENNFHSQALGLKLNLPWKLPWLWHNSRWVVVGYSYYGDQCIACATSVHHFMMNFVCFWTKPLDLKQVRWLNSESD